MIGMVVQGKNPESLFTAAVALLVMAVCLALFLLLVFLPLPPEPQSNPNEEAAAKIMALLNNQGVPSKTRAVLFEPGSYLVARTIAAKTRQLTADNVCLSTGVFDESDFELNGDGRHILFNGRTPKKVRLEVICSQVGELEDDLKKIGLPDYSYPHCNCTEGGANVCCVVTLVPYE